jgi:Tol biopolymer transport system component
MNVLPHLRWLAAAVLPLVAAGCGNGSDPAAVLPPEPDPPLIIVFDMDQGGQRDIYRIELDGSGLQNLTNSPALDQNPTVAGEQVIFTSYRDGNAELYAVPLRGGAAQRLTTTSRDESDPVLSRNGQRIAFSYDVTSVPKLWVAQASGAAPQRLTEGLGSGGSLEFGPDWANDGQRIVFVSTHEGTSNLYLHDLRDGSFAPFMVGPAAYLQPVWSPDRNWIAFMSNQDGSTDIYRKHTTTGEIQRLTNRAEADAQPAWLPDGRILYVSYRQDETSLRWLDPGTPGQLHMIPLPAGGNPRNPTARW